MAREIPSVSLRAYLRGQCAGRTPRDGLHELDDVWRFSWIWPRQPRPSTSPTSSGKSARGLRSAAVRGFLTANEPALDAPAARQLFVLKVEALVYLYCDTRRAT